MRIPAPTKTADLPLLASAGRGVRTGCCSAVFSGEPAPTCSSVSPAMTPGASSFILCHEKAQTAQMIENYQQLVQLIHVCASCALLRLQRAYSLILLRSVL